MTDSTSASPASGARAPEDDHALWTRFRGKEGQNARRDTSRQVLPFPSTPGSILDLPDATPPDLRRAQALSKGVWRIGQQRRVVPDGRAPWHEPMPSLHFADRIHRFDWLPDLLAGEADASEHARLLTNDWIARFGDFDGFAWRTGPTASRIWNWLRCAQILFTGAGHEGRANALYRQLAWLESIVDETRDPCSQWDGAVALLAGALCLNQEDRLAAALERLERAVTAQILPDGGHASRSPAKILRTLLHLQTIRQALMRAQTAIPDWLLKALPRLGGMVLFFRSGDGGLDPFNDGDEGRPECVEAALSRLDEPPRRFLVTPRSGFQKIERGTLRFILDCGQAPPRPFADQAHAGALGFELSDGAARLVTSCGFSPEVNVDWQAAVRRTGAHSTLIVGGLDSCLFTANADTGLLAATGPEGIAAKRLEDGDQVWLDAQHAGYKLACGLLHRRRVFVEGEGIHLRGEDSLARPVAQTPATDPARIAFDIRFHLHPTVTAETEPDHIRLSSALGPVWRFKTSHEGARLEKTVYLARGVVETALQIVLSGHADPNGDGSHFPNLIRWAFMKEG